MRFLLDESADGRLGAYLRSLGYDVTSIAVDHQQSLDDARVLAVAHDEDRILITDDRDFGRLVNVLHQPQAGVLYFRLGNNVALEAKIRRLDHVLTHHGDQFRQFITVSLDRVRIS
jgi:predicted nuclease of predicted toxin-antitoxin system